MIPHHSSLPRQGHPLPEVPVGHGHQESNAACTEPPAQLPHMNCYMDSAHLCPPVGHKDWHCPVCLQTAIFPVQTNCGHLFCAPCLISYWRHGSWLDAISCPLCRQKVSVLCRLFSESSSDRQEKKVVEEITDYNKRYSGAPWRVTDYLCDAPLFLQLLARGLCTMGGLVSLFFIRVVLCCLGTLMSFSSPTLEQAVSPTAPLEANPSLSGLLGVLDDLVVVFLLLICVININQQMVPERRDSVSHSVNAQGVLGD